MIKKKKVHTISDEFEFGDANENVVDEPPNAILRDFDDYLIDDTGHVATNNDDNVIYNDQLHCCKNLLQQKLCCNKL